MSEALILLSVIGGSITLLVLGVISIMVWESNSRRPPPVQGSQGSNFDFMTFLKKTSTIVAIGIMLLIACIWYFTHDSSPQPNLREVQSTQSSSPKGDTSPTANLSAVQKITESIDINLVIAIGILIALAVAGALKKGGTTGTMALVLVVGGLLFLGTDATKVLKKVQDGAHSVVLSESKSTTSVAKTPETQTLDLSQRKWAIVDVVWDAANEDESLPLNVASQSVEIPLFCTIRFSKGNGLDYQVLYPKMDGGWAVHKPGQNIEGAEIKFMVLRKGIKKVTYEISCP